METIKLGKRGTVTLPLDLRTRLGLKEGSLIVTDFKDGEIRLRPVFEYESENWTPDREAYFLLINAMTKEEWDRIVLEVMAMGVDPSRIDGILPEHRDRLPDDAEFDAKLKGLREIRPGERLRA